MPQKVKDPVKEKDRLEKVELKCFQYQDQCYKKEKTDWWIETNDYDEIVAYIVGDVETNTIYLARVGVLPQYRGMGWAKYLINHMVMSYSKIYPNHILRTDCRINNVHSLNTLVSCGFRFYKPRKPWAFKNSLYLKRKLHAVV